MGMEVLTSPIETKLYELITQTKNDLFFSCPFIKKNIAQEIIRRKHKKTTLRFLTSYKVGNFYHRASDLEAMDIFLKNDVTIKHLSHLHAKYYIFDGHTAIITSANLTHSGLKNNYECGVLLRQKDHIERLTGSFFEIYNNDDIISTVTTDIVNKTKEILSKVPESKRRDFINEEAELFLHNHGDLYDGGINTISSSLKGWTLDIFMTLLDIKKDVFTLDDVYSFTDVLKRIHPHNNHVRDKIRQQLQVLRDFGLLEFVKRGIYRKLWR